MKYLVICLSLIACGAAHAELIINGQVTTAKDTVPSNQINFQAQNNFQSCIYNLKNRATTNGVNADTYDYYTAHLTPDYSVLEKLDYQPEFKTDVWDYLSGLVDEERVADGRQKVAQHQSVLQRAANQYGVDANTIAAVWGVETNFGTISGKYPLLNALGTLSCEGRRQTYFRTEFFATMRLLQRGDVQLNQLVGSWAGAFGHTQFMPSTYERLAVDFDGDGRRDLVSSIPDALASTANFLKRAGWQTGMPWGFEIDLPAGVSIAGDGRTNKKSLNHWIEKGVTRVDGSPLLQGNLSSTQRAGLLAPAGINGPKFLVFKNFDTLYSYNASESYALAIALLADRLNGKSGIVKSWPTNDAGTSRAERREIQTLLLNRGHAIGTADGLIGDKSRHAIRQEEQRLGMTITGRAGQKILAALRAESIMQ